MFAASISINIGRGVPGAISGGGAMRPGMMQMFPGAMGFRANVQQGTGGNAPRSKWSLGVQFFFNNPCMCGGIERYCN